MQICTAPSPRDEQADFSALARSTSTCHRYPCVHADIEAACATFEAESDIEVSISEGSCRSSGVKMGFAFVFQLQQREEQFGPGTFLHL